MERKPNRLITETSPYLLQHAKNPVDWYPWGSEALERARKEERPILLSIGYAACHWCHVMERESFEDPAIAALMNQSFVCVKVDREERPDLDELYMTATVALSGSGGWPMTLFLTPDQEPFFAGTYFPPRDAYGRPGFATLLERIAELWRRERRDLLLQAARLTERIRAQAVTGRPRGIPAHSLEEAVDELRATFDPRFGGFGAAPKFPTCGALELLLRHHHRTGDADALEMVKKTLDGMKNGGIYDQLAGGFARYATDERWLVPHFEKMLYDNAQLARIYAWAFQVTGDAEYARVARETLDYVLREMQGAEGGFFSATDADSEGEEGKFFVWTPEQVRERLSPDAAEQFCSYYDVRPGGNWEGRSILNTPRPDAARAGALTAARQRLYAARKERVPPLLDDKILCSWNGLMIGAMAEGARVLCDPRYLESAERAASFVQTRLARADGGLLRTHRSGKSHLEAYLEDYAFLADGLLDLYEAGGSARWLEEAARLCERMLADFAPAAGGAFFFTAHGHEPLLARPRDGHDGALPNPNAVAARVLARLSLHLGRPEWRERAVQALTAHGETLERSPRAFATALSVLDFSSRPAVELVVVGAEREAFASALAAHYLPNRALAWVGEDVGSPTALTRDKVALGGKTTLYLCRDYACEAPLTDPGAIGPALQAHAERARAQPCAGLSVKRLAGHASSEGTRAFADKHVETWGDTAYNELGRTGLWVSRLGFGGYRIDAHTPEQRVALGRALAQGVNLIDTSVNYTEGESERLVGEVLSDLEHQGELWRDQVVVVSKIGYVQGQNLELARARAAADRPFPEMVEYGPGIWHCIHPEWLDDQLDRSLERLGLDTLDVCLLHNPEYFLSDVERRKSRGLEESRAELYRRMHAAFCHFERERARGRIRFYGVSSNTLVSAPDDPDATALGPMLEAARRAGGPEHGFRVVQLPLNLFETGATRAGGALEVAQREELAVLVNRPLNALTERGLTRLADVPSLAGADPVDAALARVAELEREFRDRLAPKLRTGSGSPPPEALLAWGERLGRLPAAAQSFAEWSQLERDVVVPRTRHVLTSLERALGGGEHAAEWKQFSARYAPALEALLLSIAQRSAAASRGAALRLHAELDAKLPAQRRTATLSQKALWITASVPGVSAVLVGMRRPEWVDDACTVLGWPKLAEAARAFPNEHGSHAEG